MVFATVVMCSALLPQPCAAGPSCDNALDSGDGVESDEDVGHINDFIMEDNDGNPPAAAGAVTVVVPENELFEGGSLETAVMEEAAKSAVRGGGQQDSLGEVWFQSSSKPGGMPTRQQIREQLDKLKRKDQLGTEDEARVKMKRDQQKARKRFSKGVGLPAAADYSALIEDGAADAAWRARILCGERVPPPFLEGGRVGQHPDFSLSAVREYLVLEKEGRLPEPKGLGGCRSAMAASGQQAEASSSARHADLQEKVEQFFVDMRPGNAQDTPTPGWIDKLIDGDMADGLGFWA
jgi:hypothetical protein